MKQLGGTVISVRVDPANPGQFFACCGLLELADRLWRGAEGWFEMRSFMLRPLTSPETIGIGNLVRALGAVSLDSIDPENETASPLEIGAPFNLRLDWWRDDQAGGEQLKVWAGRMSGLRIARAMQAVLASYEAAQSAALLDFGVVVRDPDQPVTKSNPITSTGDAVPQRFRLTSASRPTPFK